MSSEGLERLANDTLASAGQGVAVPRYDRSRLSSGIVHIGVGAFHRAHQAVYVDDCLSAGETEWGIVGASLRSAATRDALAPQDGLYTVATQDADGESLRIVGSLAELLVAPENPEALVARMAAEETRIVTLTVTEKAYLRRADGRLDLDNRDVRHDLATPERPRTVYGFLAAALRQRRGRGLDPFTVLCCDNLPANGATVRRLFLEFAEAAGERGAFDDVAFPSTMVDRIVPSTTDEDRERISGLIGLVDAWPVKAEPFMQWVVEENFPLGRPKWEAFGVTMVEDVAPFEDMKLRLLNGAHSAMAYLGLLCDRATVSEAFADPLIRAFVEGLWREAIPTLPKGAGLEPNEYTEALARRFANPALVHRTAQIAMDGSQKLPQRILATAAARLADGKAAERLLVTVAAWIACCEERGRRWPKDHFSDPHDDGLEAIFAAGGGAGETVAAIFEAVGFAAIDREGRMAGTVAKHLETIRIDGAGAAMRAAGETVS